MVQVVKANGEKEEFSEKKLLRSIHRIGIPEEEQRKVLNHVHEKLYENIPTSEIYKHVAEFLDTTPHRYSRSKYSLKQAIMELGPTGYPFEDYISKLMTQEGYMTTVRNIVRGKCITHEIDVIAKKGSDKIMVEAKFHNSTGIKTDVQVALYTYARFEDVKDKENFTKPLLVTNTKATTDAIAYAHCVGMDIITWSYPDEKSLRDLVEEYHLYPITALRSLPESSKQTLLEQDVVLCRQICANHSLVAQLPTNKQKEIIEEVNFICNKED
ncbi:MAG TPA: restriction endonuclease [Patescibacteria group bacterium]